MNRILATLMVSVFLMSPALAKDELPEVSADGLHRVHNSEWLAVYAEPDADLSGYDKVIILDTAVAFKKNWKRDYNRSTARSRISDQDMDKIRVRLAEEFEEIFREVIEEDNGYPVVTESGPDVLILRPAIIDLDVTAPANIGMGRSETYAESAGAMSLYLEIHDSQTGDLIAKGYDRKADRRSGFMTWQTSVSNKSAADRILRDWAQSLRDALDTAHSGGS